VVIEEGSFTFDADDFSARMRRRDFLSDDSPTGRGARRGGAVTSIPFLQNHCANPADEQNVR
jgi:hypothetical protein